MRVEPYDTSNHPPTHPPHNTTQAVRASTVPAARAGFSSLSEPSYLGRPYKDIPTSIGEKGTYGSDSPTHPPTHPPTFCVLDSPSFHPPFSSSIHPQPCII